MRELRGWKVVGGITTLPHTPTRAGKAVFSSKTGTCVTIVVSHTVG